MGPGSIPSPAHGARARTRSCAANHRLPDRLRARRRRGDLPGRDALDRARCADRRHQPHRGEVRDRATAPTCSHRGSVAARRRPRGSGRSGCRDGAAADRAPDGARRRARRPGQRAAAPGCASARRRDRRLGSSRTARGCSRPRAPRSTGATSSRPSAAHLATGAPFARRRSGGGSRDPGRARHGRGHCLGRPPRDRAWCTSIRSAISAWPAASRSSPRPSARRAGRAARGHDGGAPATRTASRALVAERSARRRPASCSRTRIRAGRSRSRSPAATRPVASASARARESASAAPDATLRGSRGGTPMARLRIVTLGVVSLLLVACGPGGSTTAPSSPASAAATQAASLAPSETAEPTQDACAAGTLTTKTAGTLTVGTDNPAFPPYFEGREGGNTEPWDPAWGDPTTGKGFESASGLRDRRAARLHRRPGRLGRDAASTRSFAPGDKDFDFFINQVTFNEERAENADLSDGYYFGNQTVVDAGGQRVRGRDDDHRAQGRRARRAGRDDEPRDHRGRHPDRPPRPASTTRPTTRSRRCGTARSTASSSTSRRPTSSRNVQVDGSVIVGQIGEAAGAAARALQPRARARTAR